VVSVRGNVPLRLQAVPVAGGIPVASTSMADVNRTVDRLGLILIIGWAAAGLVVAAGVIILLRRGLRPIETMAAQADRITAGDLTDRVSPHDPRTEVGRLGTALNGMLARIEASVVEQAASQEQTRRFFADASHELRTPLASLRANAQLYQQGVLRRRPEVDEAMRRITLEAKRMSKLVDDMLRLARLDQHPGQDNAPVDLSPLVTGCAERARLTGERRTWLTDVAPGLVTTGRLPNIFDRFYRAAPAKAHCPGSGLGLAIVAVVATHHGTATAELNDPHGLRVTLALPASCGPGDPALRPPAETVRHELRESDRHARGGGDRRAHHLSRDRAR